MKPKFATVLAVLLMALCSNQVRAQNEPSNSTPARKPLSEPLYEKFTTAAWLAFQAGQYQSAITNADLCIARFGEAAHGIEALLDTEKAVLPTGAVSDADKKRITRYQILNDVATCHLIKGWAEEKLGHKEQAKKAYLEAKIYTQARSARPTGESFWSPAVKASERLTE